MIKLLNKEPDGVMVVWHAIIIDRDAIDQTAK